MAYEIKIDQFEGPLDLLLHLIKKNEMDIYNIPISEITGQYLTFLDAMKALNLDVAGEFLVMAATLLHIKSRTLLPPSEEEDLEEEEEDPRAELVRRLLEYRKYKEAAQSLDELPRLDSEVFTADQDPLVLESAESDEYAAVGLYELVEAFQRLLQEAPEETFHEVSLEQLSVTDRINHILTLLGERKNVEFREIFGERPPRQEIVVTFLGMLELVKMRMVRLMQNSRFGQIWIYPAVSEEAAENVDIGEDSLGYT